MKENSKKYYQAYDERYKTAHNLGVSWEYMHSTPIVLELLTKYDIDQKCSMLEIGCGEGRDSKVVLEKGYNLLATDISSEAISYCKATNLRYADNFKVLDCISENLDASFDFIFSIAVIHMLVEDNDRDEFYNFIKRHLKENGIALICSMGDGKFEKKSDADNAYSLVEREHFSGKMVVPATTCRMVSFNTFENEIERNGLEIVEKGIVSSMPNFDSLMYAVVRKRSDLIAPILQN